MSSSRSDEVLVASTAPGFILASSSWNRVCLTSSFSTMASITTSACLTCLPSGSAIRRPTAASTACLLRSCLANRPLARRERLLGLGGVEILEARLHAADDAPGGDIAAHGAGADDMHPLRLEAVLRRLVLQHLREHEHAAEIARGLARHQRREHLRLRRLHARRVVAILLEEIDQAVRRRVMVLAHLGRGLGAHLLGKVAAHRLLQHQLLPPRRALGAALLQHGFPRGPAEIVLGRHDLIDQPHGAGSGRAQHAAGEHGGHGVHGAGELESSAPCR